MDLQPARQPFVLLEDLEAGVATLFESPHEALTATDVDGVARALERADELVAEGQALAGWIGYEAGYALEQRLERLLKQGDGKTALLRLFQFHERLDFPIDEVDGWLVDHSTGSGQLGQLEPGISFDQYATAFNRVKEAITDGDIYQANLTFPLRGAWHGDPLALYRAIRPEAKARFAALMFDGLDWLLSFSPELFFSVRDQVINVRPMKGTRPRGTDAESDRRHARELAESVKDRAENLMIVDLMRNDLSRISRPGSVKVDDLFRVESYPTLFQMTTGVAAEIDGSPTLARLVRAMFPCGSITGAPKVRAMEIIREVEHADRGVYCGAIGEIGGTGGMRSNGEGVHFRSQFNVAIRTLRLRGTASTGEGLAEFGVGSGIVADSVLEDEWEECLLKSRFVERSLVTHEGAGNPSLSTSNLQFSGFTESAIRI